MKFLKTILTAFALIVTVWSANAQDFTLSENTKVRNDYVYQGSVLISGDSCTLTFDGLFNSYSKDVALGSLSKILTGTSLWGDTTNVIHSSLGVPAINVRLKVVDSLATKYSNYIDCSTFNGEGLAYMYVTAQLESVSATVKRLWFTLYASRVDIKK